MSAEEIDYLLGRITMEEEQAVVLAAEELAFYASDIVNEFPEEQTIRIGQAMIAAKNTAQERQLLGAVEELETALYEFFSFLQQKYPNLSKEELQKRIINGKI